MTWLTRERAAAGGWLLNVLWSIRTDYHYERQGRGRAQAAWTVFAFYTAWLARRAWCAVWSHAWVAEAHDAENGTEDIRCNRCGESHHFQF
jgi:hypothetical protein